MNHSNEALSSLLEQGIQHSPRYLPSNNSDHLPMTLCAIIGLGGDHNTCLSYREGYKPILHDITESPPLRDWRDGIGQFDQYPALLTWFQKEVKEKGIEKTVGEYLPEFIGSLAMDAFHPIIRLGYGIDFESDAETAAALAYLVACYHEVPVNPEKQIEIGSTLTAQSTARAIEFQSTNFSLKIKELVVAENYPTGNAPLVACAEAALRVYLSTRNFFALHMVTATQAIRICSRYVEESLATAALTGGLLAAHRVVGSPGFADGNPLPAPKQLDREHTYKYAWTCLSEYRYSGIDLYAQEIRLFREAGLIPEWCARADVA